MKQSIVWRENLWDGSEHLQTTHLVKRLTSKIYKELNKITKTNNMIKNGLKTLAVSQVMQMSNRLSKDVQHQQS
jgi:hypothetical protein